MWVADRKKLGKVVVEQAPRSYKVETGDVIYTRNRRHLVAALGVPISDKSATNIPVESSQDISSSQPSSTRRDLVATRCHGKLSKGVDFSGSAQ